MKSLQWIPIKTTDTGEIEEAEELTGELLEPEEDL